MPKNKQPLFYLLNTPVYVDASTIFSFISFFGLAVWVTGRTSKKMSWNGRVQVGIFTLAAYAMTDLVHFGGHIFSSRQAQAPMDAVHIKAPMPQSVYINNNVSPKAHILRAVGGPIASIIAMAVILLIRPLTATGSIARTFINTVALLQGLIGFGSLIPLPMIDGGTILKWSLLERKNSPKTEG